MSARPHRFETEAQANYVASAIAEHEDGDWFVAPHGDHWHVVVTGVAAAAPTAVSGRSEHRSSTGYVAHGAPNESESGVILRREAGMNQRETFYEQAAYRQRRQREMEADAELRRLARIGAWVEAHPAAEWIEDDYIAASLTGEAVHDYRSEAIAAGDMA